MNEVENQEFILQQISAGTLRKVIAKELGISEAALSLRVKRIDPNLVNEAESKGLALIEEKRARRLIPFKEEIWSREKIEHTIDYIPYEEICRKINTYTLGKYDIIKFRDQINKLNCNATKKKIELMINIYIRKRQYDAAISFLNDLIKDENMHYLGKEKLILMKKKVEDIRNKRSKRMQEVRNNQLKNGKANEEDFDR